MPAGRPRRGRKWKRCKVKGCLCKVRARGFCELHYYRDKRERERAAAGPKKLKVVLSCQLCGGRHHARGLCRSHYEQWRRETLSAEDRAILVRRAAPPPERDYGGPDTPLDVWFARQRARLSGGGPAMVWKTRSSGSGVRDD